MKRKAEMKDQRLPIRPSLFFLILAFTLIFPVLAQKAAAHPVAFEGATAVQFFSTSLLREAQVYHSFSAKHSLGTRFLRLDSQSERREFLLGGVNGLVKRWNAEDSQANLYLGIALGNEMRSFPNGGKANGVAALLEVNADWESRKHYLATQIRRLSPLSEASRPGRTLYSGMLRVGFAPYIAEYGDIHTWVILEVDRITHSGMSTQLTPLLRFFHRNVLFEIGRSFDDHWKFNFMIHL